MPHILKILSELCLSESVDFFLHNCAQWHVHLLEFRLALESDHVQLLAVLVSAHQHNVVSRFEQAELLHAVLHGQHVDVRFKVLLVKRPQHRWIHTIFALSFIHMSYYFYLYTIFD